MVSKLSLVALVALVAVVAADGPFCSLCQKMVNDVKTKYNNDFSSVTAGQLVTSMKGECDSNTSGFEDSICKKIVSDNNDKLLAALKASQSSYQVCQTGNLC
ncbi:hypothetical protein QR680_008794 [Steinernema hermaphroditum]|nr:hypothetical protein QR680_008794 [Steinernema hermaphroditum]